MESSGQIYSKERAHNQKMDPQEFPWPTKRLCNFGIGRTFVCEFSSKVRFPVIFVATDAVGDFSHIFKSRNSSDPQSQSINLRYSLPGKCSRGMPLFESLLMIRICERSFFEGQSLEEGVRDHTGKLPREDSGRRKRRSRRLS
jgi:hypothetical protein